MTNTEARKALNNLEQAILRVRRAVDEEAGYATVGECEQLDKAWAELQKVVEVNNWKNIPF